MNTLIQKALTRDSEAFTELMQSQMQNLYKTARAILNQDEDVADAIQETILTCWEKLDTLKNPQYFRTWMTRILINKCNDLIRKNRHHFPTEQVPDIPISDTGYENSEWLETLKSLPEKYRLILILYYVDGLGCDEISRLLDLPKATVRTRLSRGRSKIAGIYQVI